MLILPPRFAKEKMQTRLRDMVLDFVYKHICQKHTNDQINDALKAKNLPTLAPEELSGLRNFFKAAESEHPQKMAKFRQRLGV